MAPRWWRWTAPAWPGRRSGAGLCRRLRLSRNPVARSAGRLERGAPALVAAKHPPRCLAPHALPDAVCPVLGLAAQRRGQQRTVCAGLPQPPVEPAPGHFFQSGRGPGLGAGVRPAALGARAPGPGARRCGAAVGAAPCGAGACRRARQQCLPGALPLSAAPGPAAPQRAGTHAGDLRHLDRADGPRRVGPPSGRPPGHAGECRPHGPHHPYRPFHGRARVRLPARRRPRRCGRWGRRGRWGRSASADRRATARCAVLRLPGRPLCRAPGFRAAPGPAPDDAAGPGPDRAPARRTGRHVLRADELLVDLRALECAGRSRCTGCAGRSRHGGCAGSRHGDRRRPARAQSQLPAGAASAAARRSLPHQCGQRRRHGQGRLGGVGLGRCGQCGVAGAARPRAAARHRGLPSALAASVEFLLRRLAKMSTDSSCGAAPARYPDYSLTGLNARLAIERGLAEAQWYQSPVARDRLRALLERRDGPALRDTMLWFALLLLTAWASLALSGSWWALLPYMAYAVLYATASDSRWHETSHGTAFKTDWMNDALYEIASFMVMRESVVWRWSHNRHHSDTLVVGRDPEIQVTRPPDLRALCLSVFNIGTYRSYFPSLLRHAGGQMTDAEKTFLPASEFPKAYPNNLILLSITHSTTPP